MENLGLFSNISNEVCLHIFTFIDIENLFKSRLVCKWFNEFINECFLSSEKRKNIVNEFITFKEIFKKSTNEKSRFVVINKNTCKFIRAVKGRKEDNWFFIFEIELNLPVCNIDSLMLNFPNLNIYKNNPWMFNLPNLDHYKNNYNANLIKKTTNSAIDKIIKDNLQNYKFCCYLWDNIFELFPNSEYLESDRSDFMTNYNSLTIQPRDKHPLLGYQDAIIEIIAIFRMLLTILYCY